MKRFMKAILLSALIVSLAWSVAGYNAQLGRVVTADIVALACLVVGAAAYAMSTRGG